MLHVLKYDTGRSGSERDGSVGALASPARQLPACKKLMWWPASAATPFLRPGEVETGKLDGSSGLEHTAGKGSRKNEKPCLSKVGVKPTPSSCPLTFTCVLLHIQTDRHRQTQMELKILKDSF